MVKKIWLLMALLISAVTIADAGTNRPGEILWRYKLTGKPDFFSGADMKGPFLHEDRVYVTSDDESRLYCLDMKTGNKRWEFSYLVSAKQNWIDHGQGGRSHLGAMMNVPIKKATPLLFSNGRIYFGASTMNAFWGCTFCIDAGSGKLFWRKPAKAEVFNPFYSVNKGLAYFDYGCLNADTGVLVWDRELLTKSEHQKGNYIFITEDYRNLLYASGGSEPPISCYINRGVKKLWEINNFTHLSRILPYLDQERIFFCGEGMDTLPSLFCVDVKSGKVLWEFHAAEIKGFDGRGTVFLENDTSLIRDGVIYILARQDNAATYRFVLTAIDAAGGSIIWKVPIKGDNLYTITPPAILDGRLYYLDSRMVLHCLSAAAGKELWNVRCAEIGDDEMPFASTVSYRPAIMKNRAFVNVFTHPRGGPFIVRKEVVCLYIDN